MEKRRGMANCNGKGNGTEGKYEAYRLGDGVRGGKGSEEMGRGKGNTGNEEGKEREERKVKRAGKENKREKGTGKTKREVQQREKKGE